MSILSWAHKRGAGDVREPKQVRTFSELPKFMASQTKSVAKDLQPGDGLLGARRTGGYSSARPVLHLNNCEGANVQGVLSRRFRFDRCLN
jgi:hypothetical protein